MRRKLPIIIIVGVLLVALAGGALLMRPATQQTNIAQLPPTITSPDPQATAAATTAPRPAASNIAPITHLRGRADAPLLLEEYGDF
ncbi:MAG TPA: hypothetical protein VF634_11300, partial [Pyrinomonadaceae bacterium]